MARKVTASRTVSFKAPSLPPGKRAENAMSGVTVVGMLVIGIGTYLYQASQGTATGGAIVLGVICGVFGALPAVLVAAVLYPFFWLYFYVTADNTMQVRTDVTAEAEERS